MSVGHEKKRIRSRSNLVLGYWQNTPVDIPDRSATKPVILTLEEGLN